MKVSEFDRRMRDLSEAELRQIVERGELLVKASRAQGDRPASRDLPQSEK
jgi:hypothetical protein